MTKYCEKCNKEVETNIITKKESFTVCGENIEVNAQILVCSKCGEELFSEELDSATLVNAYNEYRKRHKLLLPAEIKKIREQYGLSQRSFSKLLNWGDKTICRYENGAIQDKAHNSLLLFLREPQNMRAYLENNEITLEERHKNNLLKIVGELELNTEPKYDERILDEYFPQTPCEENGFRKFNYEKLCAMVLYFAHKSTELLKTKLMKLLNYSDMIFYKENGISISGLRYKHLQYGPVPEHFEMLLWKMGLDHIVHIEISNDGYERHQIVAECEFPEGVLSKEEMALLDRIHEKFKNFGSREISNYSHKEIGYQSTQQDEIISYRYAKDIQLM